MHGYILPYRDSHIAIANLIEILLSKKLSALYLKSNLVTSTNKNILEILMHILSWMDFVRSSTGQISYIDIFCPLPPQSGVEHMEMPGVRPLEICCKCSKISNLHTSIILGISSFSSKKIEMSAKTHQNFIGLQFQRKLIFRRFSS